jgi:lipopolysaccharide heptosyltransferase I
MRLLIVRLGALGDIVHALPALAALRRTFPEARIDWLVDARHRAVLDLVSGLTNVLVVNTTQQWSRLPFAVRDLRATRYDIALDLQGLLKSAVLARASAARRVLGFERTALREPLAARFYSELCPVDDRGHVVRKNLTLAEAAGAVPGPIVFPFVVPPLPSGVEPPYALINPGAGWPNKQWPPDRFGALAAWICATYGLRSLVAWGPREETLAASVVEHSKGSAQLAPRTSIGDLLAIAKAARLVISGDTGPMHLAAAVGTPLVGLFGPTNPVRNGPFDPADVSVDRFNGCICHHQRRCRRDTACIATITLEEVQAAVERRLTRTMDQLPTRSSQFPSTPPTAHSPKPNV